MTPLYADRVAAALSARGDDFKDAQKDLQANLQALQEALDEFSVMSSVEVDALISEVGRPGARTTTEQDDLPFIVPFGGRWDHHREAREWAAEMLSNVTTFAADGSQIFPSTEMSIPVGLVQIGWFENPHDGAGSYIKDVQVEVLTPDDLDEQFEPGYAEREIEWRRFYGEVRRTIAFMEAHAGQPALAFFDGSLILSFVHTMREARQRHYIQAINRLIDASEATGVPLVGYVDTSHAADLTTLLTYTTRYRGGRVGDAALLRMRMQWGDRCRLFVCSRDDEVTDNAYYERVVFTYLKSTRTNPPARIELPRWIFESGQHEWVLDIVRAECVVGVGYPYPLETADAVAVLSMQDRERFYRLFQEFADRHNIAVRYSRKALHKRRRRV